MKLRHLISVDVTALHVICIEAPGATINSIKHRMDLLIGEEVDHGAIGGAI